MDDGGWFDFKFKLKRECKPWIPQTTGVPLSSLVTIHRRWMDDGRWLTSRSN
jgi:hypothetical protein